MFNFSNLHEQTMLQVGGGGSWVETVLVFIAFFQNHAKCSDLGALCDDKVGHAQQICLLLFLWTVSLSGGEIASAGWS